MVYKKKSLYGLGFSFISMLLTEITRRLFLKESVATSAATAVPGGDKALKFLEKVATYLAGPSPLQQRKSIKLSDSFNRVVKQYIGREFIVHYTRTRELKEGGKERINPLIGSRGSTVLEYEELPGDKFNLLISRNEQGSRSPLIVRGKYDATTLEFSITLIIEEGHNTFYSKVAGGIEKSKSQWGDGKELLEEATFPSECGELEKFLTEMHKIYIELENEDYSLVNDSEYSSIRDNHYGILMAKYVNSAIKQLKKGTGSNLPPPLYTMINIYKTNSKKTIVSMESGGSIFYNPRLADDTPRLVNKANETNNLLDINYSEKINTDESIEATLDFKVVDGVRQDGIPYTEYLYLSDHLTISYKLSGFFDETLGEFVPVKVHERGLKGEWSTFEYSKEQGGVLRKYGTSNESNEEFHSGSELPIEFRNIAKLISLHRKRIVDINPQIQ